jgi:high-affinity nickel-transport protein
MFGGFFCTLVSSVFLLLIGFINLSLFLSTYKVLKEIKQGKIYEPQYVENLLQNRGFLSSRFKRIFKMITHSWQMYLLGFLFGLGFDTATEIALLGIAATQTLDGFGLSSVLIFPTLFMAGMTLIDTLDCLLMFGAYGWAFLNPIRKLYYNLSIMFVSVSVAFIIGLLESLNLLVTKVEIHGQLGSLIRLMSSQSGSWGYYIIFIFIISLVISLIYSKTKSQVQAKRDQVIDSLDPI